MTVKRAKTDMMQRLISLIFRPRHYWRHLSFDEMAELYTSRLIMIFATNIVGLFVSVYLYKQGYSVPFILLLYVGFYLFKILIVSPIAAKLIAHFGPKHGILFASITRVPCLVAMALVPIYKLPAAIIFLALHGVSVALYNISYNVDFSKVRHADHTGKELGTMQLVDQTARVLSPIIGGFIASVFGPTAIIIIAATLFLLSAIPLFKTIEPVPTRSKITIVGMPWRHIRLSLFTETIVGVDNATTASIWFLFISAVVFSQSGNGIYAIVGTLSAISVLVSMATAWVFGKITDRHEGDTLFTVGVVVDSIVHAFRAFSGTAIDIVGVNIANEISTTAYNLPWTRAKYEIADTSGFRIAYFTLLQMALDFGAGFICLLAFILVWYFGLQTGLQLSFLAAALLVPIMTVGRQYTK